MRGILSGGADVVRLNFSHGTPDEHAQRVDLARRTAAALGRPMGVLQDLPGPKLRIGALPGGAVDLAVGTEVVLTTGIPAAGEVAVAYPYLTADLQPGHRVFLQDGELSLIVRQVDAPRVRCDVECGGHLREHAGLNLPDVTLNVPPLSDDDLRHLDWGVAHSVDFIGLSFVERAEDINRVRALAAARGARPALIAKIERRRALDRIHEIIAAADGVMVARGDLAVETSFQDVPIIQKTIIGLCNRVGKPVITATQMLESMIVHSRPTRAEAADVANAVFDGTDALMLSAETAVGAHPVEAVTAMAAIAARADAALPYEAILRDRARLHARERAGDQGAETSEAIALAACQAAEAVGAAAIVASTESGSTARRVSRFRPRRPIIAVTHAEPSWRQLSLVWGVRPVLVEPSATLDELVDRGVRSAVAVGAAHPNELVVVTAGFPLGRPGTTNFLKVVKVEPHHLSHPLGGSL
jgi:pyruvate kinase